MTRRPVNERQLDVLSWIVKGCPPREWPDATYKTVAVALQNRRLATVIRKGGVWRVEPTDAGRYYVEHGTYPPGHWAATETPAQSLQSRQRVGTVQSRPTTTAPAETPPSSAVASNQTATATASTPPPLPVDLVRLIRVPSRMSSRPHPAIANIQGHPHALGALSRPLRARALRILDTLAKEAQRRGYKVAEHDGRMRITIRGHTETVELREPTTRTRHVPTEAELAAQARASWRRPPKWDIRPSGRLRALVGHTDVVEPKPRKDGTMAWILEGRLDRVLGLVEDAAATKEQRERRRREDAEARQRHWENVRTQAVVQFHEHRRVEALRNQVDRWQECQRIDAFVQALDDYIATLTEGECVAAAGEWRRWIADYAARRSPFAQPLRMPPEVEPSAQDLSPFMRGLSPYGAGF